MLSLVADYNTTSSSSSEEEDNTEIEQNQLQKYKQSSTKPQLLLPSANLLLSTSLTKASGGEVFSNPFLEAEKLEIDKLQKHVKMVDSENHLMQKNGRKICWNNRKGRCRFGNKCKYAHDSDIETSKDERSERQRINNEHKFSSEMKISISKPPLIIDSQQTTECELSGESTEKSKNRKRPGLGDNIIPGKRVMKTYHQTKKSS